MSSVYSRKTTLLADTRSSAWLLSQQSSSLPLGVEIFASAAGAPLPVSTERCVRQQTPVPGGIDAAARTLSDKMRPHSTSFICNSQELDPWLG